MPRGGNYESFAYDVRNGNPTFYVTEDTEKGPLVRFIPDYKALLCYEAVSPQDRWCTLNSGTYSFLNLSRGDCQSGTFSWDSYDNNQGENYPNAEGIDCRGMCADMDFLAIFPGFVLTVSTDGICYFVSKAEKCLYALDLDNMAYTASSTKSGAFNRQPDQIKAIVGDLLGLSKFHMHGKNEKLWRLVVVVVILTVAWKRNGVQFTFAKTVEMIVVYTHEIEAVAFSA